jgi:hypothetical protein
MRISKAIAIFNKSLGPEKNMQRLRSIGSDGGVRDQARRKEG